MTFKRSLLLLPLIVGIALSFPFSFSLPSPRSWNSHANTLRAQQNRELMDGISCITFPPLSPLPQDYAPLTALLEQFASNLSASVTESDTPSISVNLIYDQNVIFSQGFGLKNLSDPASGAPTGDTMYRIGSNTKMFTVLMALMAQDRGVLSLNEEVASYVPEFDPINPFPSERSISFAELASHMSGLPRECPCISFEGECDYSNAVMWERLNNVTLIRPPGAIPEYSNLGIAALGHAVEQILQSNWSTLLETMILQPLNMTNSGAYVDAQFINGSAVGYTGDDVANLVDIGWESPAGSMYSTTNDMSKLMSLIFRDNIPYMQQPNQIMDSLSIREWLVPRYANNDMSGFGLPWEILASPFVYSKDGEINGYTSFFVFVPQLKFGMTALQSSDDDSGAIANATMLFLTAIRPFAEIMAALAPPPFIPAEFKNWMGSYSFLNATIEITVIKLPQYPIMALLQDDGGMPLQYVSPGMYLMTFQGLQEACIETEAGLTQYVYFKDTTPPTFTIPGLVPGITATMISN